MEIYKVGGAVRDKLLGLPVSDTDWVVVGATPEEMLGLGYLQVGRDFPVFLHPVTHQEYALARTERKTAPGYKGFQVHATPDVTLTEDLQRRDLTINAIAETPTGTLIDPFNGQADLRDKVLRHVSAAFTEDPVRILRVARFAARFAPHGFTIAAETLALMQQMVAAGEVDALVPERVWTEWARALAEASPTTFVRTLRDCGALSRLVPELDQLFGVPQPAQHHPEIDTGDHTLMVLDVAARLSSDPRMRFAALMHDLGKGTTPANEWPHHIGHEERGATLVENICKRFRIPNDYRELAMLVSRYHLHCHRAQQLKTTTLLKTLMNIDAMRRPERFELFLLACEADARGRLGMENDPYPQADVFRNACNAAISIDTKILVDQGFQGEKFAKELYDRRLAAIKRLNLVDDDPVDQDAGNLSKEEGL